MHLGYDRSGLATVIPQDQIMDSKQQAEVSERYFRYLNIPQQLLQTGARITDWNGHNQRGAYWNRPGWYRSAEQREADFLRGIYPVFSDEALEQLEAALAGGDALKTPVFLGASSDHKCRYCDARLMVLTDGKTLLIAGDPCPVPDGFVHHDIELNVPSGILVVGDDLQQWYPTKSDRDINGLIGTIQMIDDYAKIGLAMGAVGNSSPSLRRVKDAENKFVISNHGHDWDDEDEDDGNPWGETLADICTDLWWYSIADGDDFKRRLAHYTPDIDIETWENGLDTSWTHTTVKVKPGVYRFRWFTDAVRDATTVLYAEIEWVREPDPVVDHLADSLQERFSALECCIQSCLDWPMLYMPDRERGGRRSRLSWPELSLEQQHHAIARAANQIMCVLGGGIDWHENGHALMNVSEEVRGYANAISEDGVVPLFTEAMQWYPFSGKGGGLCQGAGIYDENPGATVIESPRIRLNDTFALLALNIAQNYIQFPPKPRLNRDAYPPRFGIKEVRNRMRLALDCYRGIRQNYIVEPMDPDFDKFAPSEEAVTDIAQRDLGPDNPPAEQWGPVPPILLMGEHKFVEFKFDPAKTRCGPCWHPGAGGCWAKPEDAQRYAILYSKQDGDGFTQNAGNSVPLQFVARIVGTESTRTPILLVEFDYGHEQMHGAEAHRWGISGEDVSCLRAFDDPAEYDRLLHEMVKVYEDMEALVKAK